MSKSFSLKRLSEYIDEDLEKIGAMRQEVEEIQIGFNSAFVEWKAEHDATLESLTQTVLDRLEEVGPDLRSRIDARVAEERADIDARRQELRDELIPKTQTKAHEALTLRQALMADMRELNPQLDRREEKLKAQRAALQQELAQLNEQIRDLSGCLGLLIRFRKINQLDRQRQRVIGRLESVQQDLKEVREEWQSTRAQTGEKQEALQAEWQESTVRLAQLRGELAHLDEEASREALALRRAARHVIDSLKEPVPCAFEDLKQELDAMVEYNIQTDDYQAGMGSVGSLMSVLDGISEGLKRFNESVQGLIDEQKMHSAHLPELEVSVPDGVLSFHQQWEHLRQKVRDDHNLGAHPAEFVAAVQPVMEKDLSDVRIKAMFESMGGALERATDRWRG